MKSFWSNLATCILIGVPGWWFGVITQMASMHGGLSNMATRGWIFSTVGVIMLMCGIMRVFGIKFPWRIEVVKSTEEPRFPTRRP